MKKNKGIIVVLLILALVVGLGVSCVDILNATTAKKDNGLILGLDLSGGVSITYKIVNENPSATDIADTIAKMEERAENYSTEYAVYQVGEDRITVEIPGVFDADAVLEELGSPGALYFIVEENSEGKDNYSYDADSEENVPYKLNYSLECLELLTFLYNIAIRVVTMITAATIMVMIMLPIPKSPKIFAIILIVIDIKESTNVSIVNPYDFLRSQNINVCHFATIFSTVLTSLLKSLI